MWIVSPMGWLGKHMVALTQLHILSWRYNTYLHIWPTAPSGACRPREGRSEVSLCGETLLPAPSPWMADVFIMRAVQDYSGLFWSRTSGPVL